MRFKNDLELIIVLSTYFDIGTLSIGLKLPKTWSQIGLKNVLNPLFLKRGHPVLGFRGKKSPVISLCFTYQKKYLKKIFPASRLVIVLGGQETNFFCGWP